MVEFFSRIVEFLWKIPATLLGAIIIFLGLILFLPAEYAEILEINKFRDDYRVFLGPAFLLTTSFFAARVAGWIFSTLKSRHVEKRNLILMQEALTTLTPEEKGYLVPYIIDKKNTVCVGLDDGIMNGLVAKGIIYRAANMVSLVNGAPFNMQPWAREYLESNPHLLEGYVGAPMTPRERAHLNW